MLRNLFGGLFWGFFYVVFTVTSVSGRHSSLTINCKKVEKGLGRHGCLKDIYSFIRNPSFNYGLVILNDRHTVTFSFVVQFAMEVLFLVWGIVCLS